MKMNKLIPTSILSTALLLPAGAFAAEGVSYSFIEGNFIIQDIDLFEDNGLFNDFIEDFDDGDGYNINGSIAISERFFLHGGYGSTEADFGIVNNNGLFIPQGQDIKTLKLGGGFHMPMSDRTDFVASASYIDVDFGTFNFGAVENDDLNSDDDLQNAFDDLNEDSSDGYSVDAGVRSQMADWLEVGAGARYTDLDSGDDISLFGNLLFEINDNFGINLGGDFGDNISTYSLGLRYSF